jgi:hypothetical protein
MALILQNTKGLARKIKQGTSISQLYSTLSNLFVQVIDQYAY